MPPLKTFLTTAALAFLLLLATAAPAAAEGPCWKAVINDWYDGRIDNTYPIPCYQEAIQHLPEDVQTYSSAKDEISRALLAAIRHDREPGDGAPGGDGTTAAFGGGDTGSKGFISAWIERLGPSNAEAVPLPLLVLATIALMLLAAAAASFAARRIQARRLEVAPAPIQPVPKRH